MAEYLEIEGFPLQQEHHDEVQHRRLIAEAVNRLAGLVFGLAMDNVQPAVDVTVNSTIFTDLGMPLTIAVAPGGRLRLMAEIDLEVTTSRLLEVEIVVDGVAVRNRKWNPQAASLLIPTATHTFPMTLSAPVQTVRSDANTAIRVSVQAKTESGGSFTVKTSSLLSYILLAAEPEVSL